MKVVVTGADGFIGRPLGDVLKRKGHAVTRVTRADGDVSVAQTWTSLPTADVVVHLAAKTTGRGARGNPGDFFRTNVVGTVEALRYCEERKARLVYLSSYLYGNAAHQPVAETAPVIATNPYSLSKKEAEEACRFYAESGVDVTVLRPFNVYGPGQRKDFLIPDIIRQARDGSTITVADQNARRDYVFISDLVDAIARAVVQPLGFRILNIGTGTSHSVGDIVEILRRLMHKPFTVTSTGEDSEIHECRADYAAIMAALGWTPTTTLEAGLREMLAS